MAKDGRAVVPMPQQEEGKKEKRRKGDPQLAMAE
jgi:hypothetical protein